MEHDRSRELGLWNWIIIIGRNGAMSLLYNDTHNLYEVVQLRPDAQHRRVESPFKAVILGWDAIASPRG